MRINALSMLFFYYIILFLFFGRTAICQSIILKPYIDDFKYYYCYYSYLNEDTVKMILYKSDIVNDSEVVFDSIFRYPEIFYNNKLVYKVKADEIIEGYFSYKEEDIKIVNVNNKYYYFVLINKDLWYNEYVIFDVLTGRNVRIEYNDEKYFGDIDNDGYYEVGGSVFDEGAAYSPTLIYKLASTIQLDSLLSKKLTLERYIEFHGFHYLEEHVKRK